MVSFKSIRQLCMPINLLFAQQVRTQCFSKVIHKPVNSRKFQRLVEHYVEHFTRLQDLVEHLAQRSKILGEILG